MGAKHTPGPWEVRKTSSGNPFIYSGQLNVAGVAIARPGIDSEASAANARLIAAAPELHAEMLRYLPILERAEADPEIWEKLTDGLGIATANGYRAAIAKATQAL